MRSVPAPPAPDGPACVRIAGEGSCPEWEGILAAYPMIDAVQREDFPEEGASFVHLAHFYRSEDPAKEGVVVLKEFKKFFRAVGYRYDTAGDYDSRWFEGVGTRIRR